MCKICGVYIFMFKYLQNDDCENSVAIERA